LGAVTIVLVDPFSVRVLVTAAELSVAKAEVLRVPVAALFSVARPDVPNVPVTVKFPVPTAPLNVPVPVTDRLPAPTVRFPVVMLTVPANWLVLPTWKVLAVDNAPVNTPVVPTVRKVDTARLVGAAALAIAESMATVTARAVGAWRTLAAQVALT